MMFGVSTTSLQLHTLFISACSLGIFQIWGNAIHENRLMLTLSLQTYTDHACIDCCMLLVIVSFQLFNFMLCIIECFMKGACIEYYCTHKFNIDIRNHTQSLIFEVRSW